VKTVIYDLKKYFNIQGILFVKSEVYVISIYYVALYSLLESNLIRQYGLPIDLFLLLVFSFSIQYTNMI